MIIKYSEAGFLDCAMAKPLRVKKSCGFFPMKHKMAHGLHGLGSEGRATGGMGDE